MIRYSSCKEAHSFSIEYIVTAYYVFLFFFFFLVFLVFLFFIYFFLILFLNFT